MDDLGAGERLHREGMPDPRLDIRFQRRHHPHRPAGADARQDRHGLRPAGGGEGSDRGAARRAAVRSCSRPRPRISTASTASGRRSTSSTRAGPTRWNATSSPAATASTASAAAAIPANLLTVNERDYPFGWLGILAEARPFPEMSYSNHERGFALASRRSPMLSRLYVQCAPDEDLDGWSDRRIWDELHARLYDKRRRRVARRADPATRDHAAAFLCRRADALRPDVSRRRCRSHRAADRRQGPQSRRRRRARAVAGADRVLPHRLGGTARSLFRHLPQAGVEDRALFQLHDVAAASLRDAQRRSSAACSRPSWNMSQARSRRGPRSPRTTSACRSRRIDARGGASHPARLSRGSTCPTPRPRTT